MPATCRLKAIQHPPPWGKQGGLGVPINTPTTNMDEHFRAQQHQNELRAFLRYEARLSLAYRQTAYARARRPDHDHGGRGANPIQVDRK